MSLTQAFHGGGAQYATSCSQTPVCQGCSKTIRRKGASFSLKGAPKPHILLMLDNQSIPINRSKPHCDYLFIADGMENKKPISYLLPIEQSAGTKSAGEVRDQLQGGVEFAKMFIVNSIRLMCKPVFIGKMKSIELRRLPKAEYQVNFPRLGKVPIKVLRDRARLADAIDS